jgi:hypothetical protein
MKRNRMGNLAWLSRGGAVITLAACGGSGEARTSESLICPQCVEHAGGETSDFGDGSEQLPGGLGDRPGPTPCELSDQPAAIDVEAARALGFGAALELVDRSFDVPLSWTARQPDAGGPAAGYASETRLLGTTGIASLVHHVPTLAGCEDWLTGRVTTTLETADGALSIGGSLSTRLDRSASFAELRGLLDLSQAHGTLEISPPEYPSISAFIVPVIYVWPGDETRVVLSVAALDSRSFDSDVVNFEYRPLDARGPVDYCEPHELPLDLDEPIPGASESLAQLYPAAQAELTMLERPALWSSGGGTTVSNELGQPYDICDANGGGVPSYSVPYRVTSADGRVNFSGVARASSSFEAGAVRGASLWTKREAASAAATGIGGGEVSGTTWETELLFVDHTDDGVKNPALRGGLVINDSARVPLERLTW